MLSLFVFALNKDETYLGMCTIGNFRCLQLIYVCLASLTNRAHISYSTLEQKSGFRILWTLEGDTIVIWFVAKHKSVSRLMKLIDDSKSRSARQMMPSSVLAQLSDNSQANGSQRRILLDIGNAPLKVYDLNFGCLDDITKASWTPQMHLTEEERGVVQACGTVLLLGRSGTGKVSW